MKIVAIKDMSDGNAEVGEMWKETMIFEDSDPISDVIAWAKESFGTGKLRKNVVLTEAELNEKDEEE